MLTTVYKRYVLSMLMVVSTLNVFDRALMILLLQPIKEDLHLTDANLGFLTGIAFGLFYATLGLPIARWADRGNRVTIISLAISLWGATVMLCMFVTTFFQLIWARIAAAVGESGCMPPTYSLVGDYFPEPAARTRAMSIYMLSDPMCVLISFAAGGWVNEHYGWRMAFFLIGMPAPFVAALVKMSVRETRAFSKEVKVDTARSHGTGAVLQILWRQRASRHLGLGIVLFYTMGVGLSPWYASFLMRNHAMGTGELGIWLGLIFGFGGIAGTLLGGYVAAKWFAKNERGQVCLSALVIASLVPCIAIFLMLPGKRDALIALIPLTVASSYIFGPTFALMQRLVPNDIRATTMAVVMLLANLIGMGIGPQAVGFLSDSLHSMAGANSLRYAMLIVACVALWSAYHFWQVGRTVEEDLSATARHDKDAMTTGQLSYRPGEFAGAD
jgi:MFS family permease